MSAIPVSDVTCLRAVSVLVAHLPDVREGKMYGVPAFFVGSKLFACLYGDVVGLKVPEDVC